MPPGTDAGQVADDVVALWIEVDRALHPIIGHGGMAALFNRTLMMTAAAQPWMTLERCDVVAADELAALRALLARQGTAGATAGGRALFIAFEGLLVSLIGPELTGRLLQPVRRVPR